MTPIPPFTFVFNTPPPDADQFAALLTAQFTPPPAEAFNSPAPDADQFAALMAQQFAPSYTLTAPVQVPVLMDPNLFAAFFTQQLTIAAPPAAPVATAPLRDRGLTLDANRLSHVPHSLLRRARLSTILETNSAETSRHNSCANSSAPSRRTSFEEESTLLEAPHP